MYVTYNPLSRNYDFTLSPNHTHPPSIIDWVDSVLSKTVAYGGAVASGTNRYIAPTTSGSWAQDNIYEWNGSAWSETSVSGNEGVAAFVEDEEKIYVYNNATWVLLGTIIDHGNLLGLGDDDHTQYLLTNGTRQLTGDWNAGNFTISAHSVDLTCTSGVFFEGNQFMWAPGGCADDNISIGIGAGNPADGEDNIFIGPEAGALCTVGLDNIAIGRQAGYELSGSGGKGATPTNNILIGPAAGYSITEGDNNIIIGNEAGIGITVTSQNVLVGASSGYNIADGSYNTLLGFQTGYTSVSGNSNVFIGYKAGYNETGSNKLHIANSNTVTPLIYGEFDTPFLSLNGEVYVDGDTTINGELNVGGTISGTGDIYCNDLYTAGSGIYLGGLHLTYNGNELNIPESIFIDKDAFCENLFTHSNVVVIGDITSISGTISGTFYGDGSNLDNVGWSGGTSGYMLYSNVSGNLAETADMTYDVATGDVRIGESGGTGLSLNNSDDTFSLDVDGSPYLYLNSTYLYLGDASEDNSLYWNFGVPYFSMFANGHQILHFNDATLKLGWTGGIHLHNDASDFGVNETLNSVDDTISTASTDNQLVTAKLIYDYIDTVSGAMVHNELEGLQGGDVGADEFYHLNAHEELQISATTDAEILIGHSSNTYLTVNSGTGEVDAFLNGENYLHLEEIDPGVGGSEGYLWLGDWLNGESYIAFSTSEASGENDMLLAVSGRDFLQASGGPNNTNNLTQLTGYGNFGLYIYGPNYSVAENQDKMYLKSGNGVYPITILRGNDGIKFHNSTVYVDEVLNTADGDSISASSTDDQLATAKLIYNHVNTVSGALAAGGGISDIVEDTTPQLGGYLDTNGNDILFGSDTISGTGDIYCNNLHTSSGSIYLGDLHLTYTGSHLIVPEQLQVTGDIGTDSNFYVIGDIIFGTSSGTIGVQGMEDLIEVDQDKMTLNGDVEVGDMNAYYLGDATTSGTWRIMRDGDDLKFQWYDGGSWNDGNVTVNR